MFKKLKQKIEEKDNVDLTIDLSTSAASSGSLLSLSGSESSPARTSSSQESLTITSTLAHAKKVPSSDNLVSYGSEVSKDKVISKVNSMTTKAVFPKESIPVVELKKVEIREPNISTLKKENALLQNQVDELQTKLNRMISNQESNEELDGFQNQEIAKVKHLLLVSQQSLVKKEEEEKRLEARLSSASSKVQGLEGEIRKARDELNSVRALQAEKHQLEVEVDRLKQDSLKNSSILDEKDNELVHLKERVGILEKRVKDAELEGPDEKVQALILERKKMEEKLEESHQHMKEVKSTWSEKIHNLETQIFHLNRKMAEDSEESGRSEKELDSLTREAHELRESNWKLDEKVQELQLNLEKLRSEKEDSEKNWTEKFKDRESVLTDSIGVLEAQVAELVKDHTREKQELQAKLSELISSQTENVEKEIETERQITEMEDQNRRLKGELSKEEKESLRLSKALEAATASLSAATLKLQKLEPECSQLALELQESKKKLKQLQDQLQVVMEERDTLMMRNASLSQTLNLKEQEVDEERNSREREVEAFENRLLSVKLENEDLIAKVSELEKGVVDQLARKNMSEEQGTVIATLEEQLSDRNKTIKLQQKRLNDMKKTLQRELKMQPLVQEQGQDESLLTAASNGAESNYTQTKNGTNDLVNSGDVVAYDEVNFHYLRHVVFKFMTSPEYEAQHLIRAVSVLLQYNHDEEKFIRDTLDWKMSWFGSKPQPSREEKRPKAPLLSAVPR